MLTTCEIETTRRTKSCQCILSLRIIHEYAVILLVDTIVRNIWLQVMRSMFNRNNDIHKYTIRQSEPLHVPIVIANELYKISRLRGVKLCNFTVKNMNYIFPFVTFSNENMFVIKHCNTLNTIRSALYYSRFKDSKNIIVRFRHHIKYGNVFFSYTLKCIIRIISLVIQIRLIRHIKILIIYISINIGKMYKLSI